MPTFGKVAEGLDCTASKTKAKLDSHANFPRWRPTRPARGRWAGAHPGKHTRKSASFWQRKHVQYFLTKFAKYLMLKACSLWFFVSKIYVELPRPKIESRDPIFTGTRARLRVSGNDRLFPHGSEFGPNPRNPCQPHNRVLHTLDVTADNSLTGDFRLARPHWNNMARLICNAKFHNPLQMYGWMICFEINCTWEQMSHRVMFAYRCWSEI